MIITEPFGHTRAGDEAERFILESPSGMRASVLSYGATLQSLTAPDFHGSMADVAPGFPSLDAYESHAAHFGAVIGRTCGRVRGGAFAIGNTRYQLSVNAGQNHLHGGACGFDRKVWASAIAGGDTLELSLTSGDGEEGYPGTLGMKARYSWVERSSLMLEFEAVCDRDTLCNPTTHAYWNLAGHANGNVLGHFLKIHADRRVELDAQALPTGRIVPVEPGEPGGGRWFALRNPADAEQASVNSACYLPGESGGKTRLVAEVWEPVGKRLMRVHASQPALHYYGGYLVSNCPPGKDGASYGKYCGLCLEPQAISDGLGFPGLPSPFLAAGKIYRHTIVYEFSTLESI